MKRYVRSYVAGGGFEGDAEGAYRAHRAERAAEAAKTTDEEAQIYTANRMRGAL